MAQQTTVLITGCSPGGIGHALAMEFHKRGCHVIATARRPGVLRELGAMGMSTLQLDVTDQASVDACRDETAALTGGRLDMLVNNAGRMSVMPALDQDLDDAKAVFEANLFGTMRMCRAFGSLLMRARGLIINESSLGCTVCPPFYSVYSSAKAALIAYSRSLRRELRPLDVRVMVVVVGCVESAIWENPASRTDLPPDSLYQPARDVFRRAQASDEFLRSTLADVFAAKLVTAALRGEGRLGGWVGGSPDWLWEGAYVGLGRLCMALPWGFSDLVSFVMCNGNRMTRLIREAAAAKLKTA